MTKCAIVAGFAKTLLTVKPAQAYGRRNFGGGGRCRPTSGEAACVEVGKLGREQSSSLLKPTQPSNDENLNDSCASTSSVGKGLRAKLPKVQSFDGKICLGYIAVLLHGLYHIFITVKLQGLGLQFEFSRLKDLNIVPLKYRRLINFKRPCCISKRSVTI